MPQMCPKVGIDIGSGGHSVFPFLRRRAYSNTMQKEAINHGEENVTKEVGGPSRTEHTTSLDHDIDGLYPD